MRYGFAVKNAIGDAVKICVKTDTAVQQLSIRVYLQIFVFIRELRVGLLITGTRRTAAQRCKAHAFLEDPMASDFHCRNRRYVLDVFELIFLWLVP